MDNSGSIQSKLKCSRFVKYGTAVDSLAHMQTPKHGKVCTRQIRSVGIEGNMTVGLLVTKDLVKAITATYGM